MQNINPNVLGARPKTPPYPANDSVIRSTFPAQGGGNTNESMLTNSGDGFNPDNPRRHSVLSFSGFTNQAAVVTSQPQSLSLPSTSSGPEPIITQPLSTGAVAAANSGSNTEPNEVFIVELTEAQLHALGELDEGELAGVTTQTIRECVEKEMQLGQENKIECDAACCLDICKSIFSYSEWKLMCDDFCKNDCTSVAFKSFFKGCYENNCTEDGLAKNHLSYLLCSGATLGILTGILGCVTLVGSSACCGGEALYRLAAGSGMILANGGGCGSINYYRGLRAKERKADGLVKQRFSEKNARLAAAVNDVAEKGEKGTKKTDKGKDKDGKDKDKKKSKAKLLESGVKKGTKLKFLSKEEREDIYSKAADDLLECLANEDETGGEFDID